MGYRSDVMALVYPGESTEHLSRADLYEQLKTLMNTTYKEVMDEWGSSFEWLDRKLVLKFTTTDVKWYPSYECVAAFNALLVDLHADLGYETEFVRIGEDTNDIEERYSDNATYHLRVSRMIESEV